MIGAGSTRAKRLSPHRDRHGVVHLSYPAWARLQRATQLTNELRMLLADPHVAYQQEVAGFVLGRYLDDAIDELEAKVRARREVLAQAAPTRAELDVEGERACATG